MDGLAKATISVGDRTITFEGPPDFVQGEVARYVRPNAAPSGPAPVNAHPALQAADETSASEEEMIRLKKPQGHSEVVAVLAFCLAQRGVAEFAEDEMKRAYLRAKVRPPKVVSQAIRDAKNNFDYIEVGSKRGTYRLSNHGERTVRFDLPRT